MELHEKLRFELASAQNRLGYAQ